MEFKQNIREELCLNGEYTMIPNELIRVHHGIISSAEKSILFFLMSFDPSYPSYSVIERRLGVSRSSVRQAVAKAKRFGILSYKKGNNFEHKSNLYTFQTRDNYSFEIMSTRFSSKPPLVGSKNSNKNKGKNFSNSSVTTLDQQGSGKQAEPSVDNGYLKRISNEEEEKLRLDDEKLTLSFISDL